MEKTDVKNQFKKIELELRQNGSLVNYFKCYKKLKETEKYSDHGSKNICIAIIGSSTLEGIKEVLTVKCLLLGLQPFVYVAPYNQYNQEILNDHSALYEFKPDLIIFWVNLEVLFSEYFYFPYRISDEERKELTKDCFDTIKSWIEKLTTKIDSKIIVHNFKKPYVSPLGVLENKQEYGFFEAVEDLNKKLIGYFKKNSQVFILDFEAFMSKYGKKNVEDDKMRFSADMRVKPDFLPKLCDEYMSYIKPMKSINRKCIVLDLDNTLWGGVIGEDGFEGIHLGPKPPGNAFVEFQKAILNLHERGIILAINSKNNSEEALKVIKEHPYMILKEDHFAVMRINWQDKITNIKEIAEDLNIGLNSLVFIDDDKMNRSMMGEMLPEVLTVEMPEDPSLYAQTLNELNDFNILQLTEEDRQRGKMYAQQRKRIELQKSFVNLDEFLKNLELKVTIIKANKFSIPRISQLTQKTNQFNVTTRRYLEEDIAKFSESDKHLICSARVEDKFGDNGITGTFIINKKNKEDWIIDTFLLSCRVMGRKIENALLAFIIEQAKNADVKKLIGCFIPTKSNAPAKGFYFENKFKLQGKEGDNEIWVLDIMNTDYKQPEFINVKLKV